MCNELCVQFTKTAIIFVMTDMWHKDKYMHIYMRLLKYDLLVVVTCQKHVRKKFIPIKHNIMWSWEICVEISMVCPSFIWYAYIYGEFVLFHVFLAYDSALTLDGRYIKIWINEEQKIKLGLLAILLFWDTKYRDFKIILGQCRSKNFRIGRGVIFFLQLGVGSVGYLEAPSRYSGKSVRNLQKILNFKDVKSKTN